MTPVSTLVRDAVNPVLGTSFGGRGMTLDLAGYFDNPFTLRSVFPVISFDEFRSPPNFVESGGSAFPDTEFNGVLLPSVASSDCDGDGILDDGDGSGIVGDASCAAGETVNCDDNAIYTANGPDGGTCTAGSAASLGRICLGDLDCGAAGACSLAQEDSDGDGSGNVVDFCDGSSPGSTKTVRHARALLSHESFLGLSVPQLPFFDEVEAGAGIVISPPLEGVNVDFACGTCANADFNAAVPAIGDGNSLCGYTNSIPRLITQNDDQLCMRHVPSGRRYEFDLLSFRSGSSGSCKDADGGASCIAAGGEISYTRSLCPEPGQTLLAFASLGTLLWLKRRERGQSARFVRCPSDSMTKVASAPDSINLSS
jgi:hypothetical protein